MTAIMNALARASKESFLTASARTSTGTGSGVDLVDYDGIMALSLESAAGTGTTPTLAVTLEESNDNSTWTAVDAAEIDGGAFNGVVGAVSSQMRFIDTSKRKRYIREAHAIGGTTPSFTYSLIGIGFKKYQT